MARALGNKGLSAFFHTRSLGICANTENPEPLLPNWKMRWVHFQQEWDVNHQLLSKCSFSLLNTKLSFKHSVKKKMSLTQTKMLLDKLLTKWIWLVFYLLWRLALQIIWHLLCEHVMCWAFYFQEEVQEKKATGRKRTGNYCKTPLLSVTITGLPEAPVTI